MRMAPAPPACPRTRKNAAVVVADPRMDVVEAECMADPDTLRDALELVVAWAVRAHLSSKPVTVEARLAAVGAEEQA